MRLSSIFWMKPFWYMQIAPMFLYAMFSHQTKHTQLFPMLPNRMWFPDPSFSRSLLSEHISVWCPEPDKVLLTWSEKNLKCDYYFRYVTLLLTHPLTFSPAVLITIFFTAYTLTSTVLRLHKEISSNTSLCISWNCLTANTMWHSTSGRNEQSPAIV